MPCQHLGEVPVGFVVPTDPGCLGHDAVLESVRARLSSFKLPVRLTAIEDIPRTGSGMGSCASQLRQRYAREQGTGGIGDALDGGPAGSG